LLARAIHQLSGRASRRFVPVNCAALSESLLEAELFGRGTPSGHAATGKLEQSLGGTLFLDDVTSMPLALQAKLASVLRSRVLERAGTREVIPLGLRIVASCGPDVQLLLREQRFDQNLYNVLAEVVMSVPALRDRPDDIPVIAQAILTRHTRMHGGRRRGFTGDGLALMAGHGWPGNVRELQNKVEVACLLGDEAMVSAADLGLAAGSSALMPNLKEVRHRAERDAIGLAMSASSGNISRAAEILGVSRPTLYDLLARHELAPADHLVAGTGSRTGQFRRSRSLMEEL
jgi:two-component system, NtrC family, response regulator